MMVAAKTMAFSCIDLFTQQALIAKATEEFNQAKGPGFKYQSLIGDRKPALNYRDQGPERPARSRKVAPKSVARSGKA
ncbi:hypothetical protein A3860_09085 [Niastella vici]|uniref:Uncharacterized protein n=1 Tax=Niastella vici TaxID=1703345 RepID=A0A1V9FHG6_9BACT|nr:hypothetical protein [Niastella vici]OQP57770.1 hypothetical protein A3860_09085 [Niastella vici]